MIWTIHIPHHVAFELRRTQVSESRGELWRSHYLNDDKSEFASATHHRRSTLAYVADSQRGSEGTAYTERTGVRWNDVLAGISVAFVLIPQSLAYAELVGLPAFHGLYAAALPPIAAAFFASSPYLQTGPTALTAILAYGVLTSHFAVASPEYIGAAALLALLVGVLRTLLGLFRLGSLAYFMSQPVLRGFTSAAAVLILCSQVPTALGVEASGEGIFSRLFYTATHPASWQLSAVGFSLATLLLVLGGRRLSPLFPGVLAAVLVGVGVSSWLGYAAPVVGEVGAPFVRLELALPWYALPELFVGALVIAGVGFAEPTAIARAYAKEENGRWDPNRELVSQGVANVAAGLVQGFPVGGSFSRSSLGKLAGATSRWSGLVTGLVTLAFIPFASLISALPRAVLGAIVIAGVLNLLGARELVRLWRYARFQALTAYATFGLTLLLAPRIDYAVLAGVALAVGLHLWRETQLSVQSSRREDTLVVEVTGVLYFGSVHQLESALRSLPDVSDLDIEEVVVDGAGLGRVDLNGVMALHAWQQKVEEKGTPLRFIHLQPHVRRMMRRL